MKRETEILRIVRETARKLAADFKALGGGADVMEDTYCAKRAKVMNDALGLMACEIWALEEQIIIGKADLPKVA